MGAAAGVGASGADGLLDAARDAVARTDWQSAFDVATEASGVTAGHAVAEAERLELLADAAWWLGRLDVCTEAREAAYRLHDELGDQRRAGTAAVWLYEHHAFRGHGAIAGAWLRRARRALEDDPECEAHGDLLLREAEVLHGGGELDRALAHARQVVDLARRLRSADLEAEALQTAGRILIDQGHVAEGMGHLDEAMLFAVEGRLRPYSTGKVYCSLIGACEEVGDFDRAAEWTEATERWTRSHPFAIFPGICRVHRAIVLKRRGSLAEAEREAARACEELLHSRPVTSAQAWAEVGDICRRLGELDRAEEAFARSQELSGGPCAALAVLRLAQGQVEAARSIIEGCSSGAVNPLGRAGLLPTVVQVAVAAGDLAAAAGALAELEGIVDTFDLPEMRAAMLTARGRVQLARGDATAARATLQEALERWREIDVPYEVASVGTVLGQALREFGDEAAAAATFAAASQQFDRIGAHLDAQRVLDGGPPGPPVPGPALPAGLTAREAEVLRLLATGLTNNEIASRLYLSAKTVSRHLSNIFTKIGVTTRAAATAFAFEQGIVDGR
jgi:ATP/maltotriose-dependent transcriptional regulator MalT